ncbi:MAG: aminoglycoside phosphotransferase family protein [Polyangiales bacterium]
MDSVLLKHVLTHFTSDEVRSLAPLGEGHLHDTYLVQLAGARLVLQRFNTRVFADAAGVMQNISRVTAHARAGFEQRRAPDIARRVLNLRRTRSGGTHYAAADGAVFRVFDYIDGSYAPSQLERPEEAYEAARAFGEFAALMADLPAPPLHVTLPDFHAPAQRLLQLRAALAADPVGRAARVQPEVQRIEQRAELAGELAQWAQDPALRLRVAHNDAKLNNVLFDGTTQRSLAVIDLDTVMPGYLAFDFGDLVRTCTCTVAEDARDLSGLDQRLDALEALSQGYLDALGDTLTDRERASLARGPRWIVLELATRFLTDYLLDDRYFKIARPEHNLERARAQLRWLETLEARAPELEQLLGVSG